MIDQLLDLIHAATAIVASASAICAVTPTPKDDTVIAKAYAVLELLAINIGKAKEWTTRRRLMNCAHMKKSAFCVMKILPRLLHK